MGEDVINSTDNIQKLDGACGACFFTKKILVLIIILLYN